jgi:quercetin dioxygenase-like cupin family protein
MKDSKLFTPPNHINFKAKKIFENIGEIIDGSIAYIDIKGGGPLEVHTHPHNHLFIVMEGEATLRLDNEEIILKKDDSYLVNGEIPHSVWNMTKSETRMLGINIK